jgi:hypothetical protein
MTSSHPPPLPKRPNLRGLPRTSDQQNNSANNQQAADDRRQPLAVLGLNSDFRIADLYSMILFLRNRNDLRKSALNQQQRTHQCHALHVLSSFVE